MKIVVDVEREEKMVALRAEVGKITEQVIAFNTQMKAGVITQTQFAAATAPLSSRLSAAATEFKGLEASSAKAGYGMLNVGYAIDDLQYGFSSIVNNIPQIAMAIGGPNAMAIAGAAGIAAVAINQLIKHWSDMADAISSAWSGAAIGQLEQIREKAEAAAKAIESIPNATEAQQKQAGGVAKLVQNAPKEQIIAEVMTAIQALPGMREEMTDAEKHLLMRAKGGHTVAGEEATRKQIEKDVLERARKRAEQLVGEAMLAGKEGDSARERLGMLVPGRKAQLDALSPAGQKRDADAQKAEERKNREFATDEANRKEQQKMAEEQENAMERAQREGDALRKSDEAAAKAKQHDEDAVRKSIKETLEARKKAAEEGKRHRIESLEDERQSLMDTRHRIQEAIHQQPHQQAQFGSTQQYLSSLSQQETSKIPKEQLDATRNVEKAIKDVEKAIKEERRAPVAKFG